MIPYPVMIGIPIVVIVLVLKSMPDATEKTKIVGQFNPKNPKSLMLRSHCQTSGWSLTEQELLEYCWASFQIFNGFKERDNRKNTGVTVT